MKPWLTFLVLLVLATILLLVMAYPVLAAGEFGPPSPETYCWWRYDPGSGRWCYRCCDVYGCYDLFCE